MAVPSEVNNVGFRKKLFFWSSIIASGLVLGAGLMQFADYLIHVVILQHQVFSVKEVFSDNILATLLSLMGMTGTFYTIARSTKGSPEYTPEAIRAQDPTLTMTTTPAQTADTSTSPVYPDMPK